MKKNIGLLGCSRICVTSIINVINQVDDIEIYGCAARDYNRAKDFALQHNISHVFKSYQELIMNPSIDIIYISLANNLHYRWIIEAIKHNKHVLVEKPICLSLNEALNIKECLLQNHVFLLEGLMVQHHDWQNFIKGKIISGNYGKLKKISTDIHFLPKYNFSQNYRSSPEMGGGCFFDLGSYWAQFIQFILSFDFKEYTAYSEFSGPNNCDWDFKARLIHRDDTEILLNTSFKRPYQIMHVLEFEKARLVVEDFFKCRYNNTEFKILEKNLANNIVNEITFPAQNFYVNQLLFFNDVIDRKRDNININESIERVDLLEKLYILAKK